MSDDQDLTANTSLAEAEAELRRLVNAGPKTSTSGDPEEDELDRERASRGWSRFAASQDKRVQALLDEHKTPEQVADELKLPLAQVKEDVARLSEKASAPARKKGWKRERVRELVAGGASLESVASELGIELSSVRAHVYQLRAAGRLPETPSPAAPGPRAPLTPPEERRTEPAPPHFPTSGGDDVLTLRREVARQQGDQKARAARLLAVPTNGHAHAVVVDRMGDGTTQSDGTGHVHKVYRFVVSVAAGHQHGLRVPAAAQES